MKNILIEKYGKEIGNWVASIKDAVVESDDAIALQVCHLIFATNISSSVTEEAVKVYTDLNNN